MVKVSRTQTPPAPLAKQTNECYLDKEVIRQLEKDFNGKCYLCERDSLQSVEVEHLIPHGDNNELKYKWENLFLCCAHCNSVKNQRKYYGKILDCCKEDPERVINHILEHKKVLVSPSEPNETSENTIMTAQLLTECFEKTNTGIREIECQNLVNELTETMNLLYKILYEYKTNASNENLMYLKTMLCRKYRFAGFTRAYVRKHITDFPALSECIKV